MCLRASMPIVLLVHVRSSNGQRRTSARQEARELISGCRILESGMDLTRKYGMDLV